jgi:carboxymethylenebutenolidase
MFRGPFILLWVSHALLMLGLPDRPQPVTGLAADPVAERLKDSPRHHEWVDVKTPTGRTVRSWLVYPEVDRPVPVVVVIHENRGLNDWARSVTDQVAEAGFVAIAPDLLSETGPEGGGTESYPSSDAAREGIYKLPPEQVQADLDAVVEYGRTLEAGNGAVAVAGFCWGGGQTFAYATHNPRIAAAFVFYGSAPRDRQSLGSIAAPVYGFYGGNDFRITGEVPQIARTMKELGKTFEPVTYDGAGHGFMRSGEAPDADEENRRARAEAWKRWKEILKKFADGPREATR